MDSIDQNAVTALRLSRQRLVNPVKTLQEYEVLFRLMQPVAPLFFSRPGDPPVLSHRADFDDRIICDGLRARRAIVKGRFQGGTVGYVYADELALYAGAYQKEIETLNDRQRRIMDLLMSEGPLTCGIIKEESDMLAKHIMPELHKLQEAFLVYEDQIDGDWDRGWYVFEREWDGVDINRYSRTDAIAEILRRFLHLNGFASLRSMKDGLRLPGRDIQQALDALTATFDIAAAECGGEDGWALTTDMKALSSHAPALPRCVFSMHRADFLVKTEESALKKRFAGLEVLQYILIDGEFQGAAVGHWRQGPYDVEDIVLTLPQAEREARKREILDAVAKFYCPPYSFIAKYDGKELIPADSN